MYIPLKSKSLIFTEFYNDYLLKPFSQPWLEVLKNNFPYPQAFSKYNFFLSLFLQAFHQIATFWSICLELEQIV